MTYTDNAVEILLVDDNPRDAELTIRALKKKNLANSLYHVEDGVEALDFLFARGRNSDRDINDAPKVVLLDLKLPKIDGLEVLQRCKTDPRTKHIPIVVLTSSREEEDLARSYNFGVNSYVVKPVDSPQFSDAVRQVGLYWMLLNQVPAELSA